MRKIILDRNCVNLAAVIPPAAKPSPPAPLPRLHGRAGSLLPTSPEGEGRKIVEGVHYRGGFSYSGLVEFARELRQRETDAEKFTWELLRNRKFLDLKFRRQHQIGLYIVDFYCDEAKLVLELDGGIHLEKEQKEKDVIRDKYLESEGFTVLRIWNDVVLEKTEEFLKQIETIVSTLPPHSSPSPSGRGRVREWKDSTLSPEKPPPFPKRKESRIDGESKVSESKSLQDDMFRTIIYRPQKEEGNRKGIDKISDDKFQSILGENAERIRKDCGKTAMEIYLHISKNPYIKTVELTFSINKSSRTIENYIAKLKKHNFIERKGPKLGGYWEIIKKDK